MAQFKGFACWFLEIHLVTSPGLWPLPETMPAWLTMGMACESSMSRIQPFQGRRGTFQTDTPSAPSPMPCPFRVNMRIWRMDLTVSASEALALRRERIHACTRARRCYLSRPYELQDLPSCGISLP